MQKTPMRPRLQVSSERLRKTTSHLCASKVATPHFNARIIYYLYFIPVLTLKKVKKFKFVGNNLTFLLKNNYVGRIIRT